MLTSACWCQAGGPGTVDPLQQQPELPHASSNANQVQQLLSEKAQEVHQQDLKLRALAIHLQGVKAQLRSNQHSRDNTVTAARDALAEVCWSSDLTFLHQCSEKTAVYAHQALLDSIYATAGMEMEAIAVSVSLRQLSGLLMAHPFSVVSAGMHQGRNTSSSNVFQSANALAQNV